MLHPCSKLSEEFPRVMNGTFPEACEFAVGLFVVDMLHMFPRLFQGLLVVHFPGEVGPRHLCFAAYLWGRLSLCAHLLVPFLLNETGLGMERSAR